MKLSTVQQMRDLDSQAIKQYGITQEILMENAGQAAYFTILKNLAPIAGKRFTFFCGVGNNGGDGLVVARKIHSNGGRVQAFILGDAKKFKGSAALNYRIAEKLGFPIKKITKIEAAREALSQTDVVVDAIFGTGLTRDVGGLHKEVINAINASGRTVVSVDIPSGINGDTGQIQGVAVQADYTVTFGLAKLGNLLYPGFSYGGELSVTHISFPPELYNGDHLQFALNVPLPLPPRMPDAHKGSVGKALFIAGSASYFGAPYFAALSFLKAGGGLSFLAAPQPITAQIAGKGSEIIMRPQKATRSGSMALNNSDDLLEFSETVDFVVAGPGLSLAQETQTLVRELAAEIRKPLLIDGDGLTAIAQEPAIVRDRLAPTVLTPHLGEMSRLTGLRITAIEENKVNVLQETAQDLGAVIVLKGAHSLIGLPDGRVFVNLSGNAGMATAGSGDALTGAIAAMFGLGLPLEEAVKAGVFMHGFAGDLAAQNIGQDGMTAQSILDHLPEAVLLYRISWGDVLRDHYGKIRII